MAITLSEIKRMGFSQIPNDVKIEAKFRLVKVYSVEGIFLNKLESNSIEDLCCNGEDFSFGFGNSLNEIYQYIFNEDLVEDERKWIEENNAKPPFLIINVALNQFSVYESDYWKKDNNSIATWNGFSEAKKLLRIKGEKVIPQIIASLTVHFSLLHQPIRFKSILTEICGKTKLGENIVDILIEASMIFSNFTTVSSDQIKPKIHDSLNLYSQFDSKVSFFLYSAIQEKDRLKQFLFFFFAIEIYTHQTFKRIDFRNYVNNINQIPDRIRISGEQFFLELQEESRTLSQRFHWCAILIWVGIDDNDIENFKSIKKIRDKIAHGEIISEPMLPIDMIERLCLKVLSSHQTS